MNPPTGFFRDGCCTTGPENRGRHVVCAQVTAEFLAFSGSRGNDLFGPRPEFAFPGLKLGIDGAYALRAGRRLWRVTPPVVLAATHEAALGVVELFELKRHAHDLS
jgi:uncharacterized protein (DUF2237 family)